MNETQDTNIVPPRVATSEPDMLEAYHNLVGMITALEQIDNLHIDRMPGILLAKEAIKAEVAKDRGHFFAHLSRFVAQAGLGNEYVAAGYTFDRRANEIVVEVKSLIEIDEEMEAARERAQK